MMNRKRLPGSLLALVSLTTTAMAAEVRLDWRYQEAASGALRKATARLDLPASGATDPGIGKTIFVARLARTLTESLKRYHEPCSLPPVLDLECGTMSELPMRCLPPHNTCEQQRTQVADHLLSSVGELDHEVRDVKIAEALDLVRQLAANMKKHASLPQYPWWRGGGYPGRVGGPFPAPMPKSFGGGSGEVIVTTGGAKDIAAARKVIAEGDVPAADAVSVEGFMSEFELPLSHPACHDLICINPAVSVDADAHKLYVQVGMDSDVTAETFHRKPLNLALVIDISGSMASTDGTEKSRVEWAKDAALHALEHLGEIDRLSVVVFDGTAEVLVEPTRVADKARIADAIRTLAPRGSTNLEAGLHLGYDLVSKGIEPGYESRVILISDAGLNTGVTDEASLTKLVSDFAGESIGLTAIGVGDNFNARLIHDITTSRGGNYIFVESGKRMFEYFDQFDFLVSPVAYDFKATLSIDGAQAKLARAYGVPATEGQPLSDLLDVRSLFFAGPGSGGAILLEYDLTSR